MGQLITVISPYVCAAMLAAAFPHAAFGAGEVPAPAAPEFRFFTYLQSTKPEAALVAFNPTNYDPRPGSQHKLPTRASIEADLRALRPAFDGLILYAYDPAVTPLILEGALRHGYRSVLLGVWDPRSEDEITGIATLVTKYQNDLALAACIGNEGIAFNRYTLSDIQRATDRVDLLLRAQSHVPLCTSEPLATYDRLTLQTFGDFLAPNIHPAFDRPKLGPREAVAWVRERASTLAQAAHKPVLVKETGFPHGGERRFTPQAQTAFWTAYVAHSRFVRLPGECDLWVAHAAAFEAFDLPWKAEMANMPIEGAWGLLDTKRKPYPAFTVWEDLRAGETAWGAKR